MVMPSWLSLFLSLNRPILAFYIAKSILFIKAAQNLFSEVGGRCGETRGCWIRGYFPRKPPRCHANIYWFPTSPGLGARHGWRNLAQWFLPHPGYQRGGKYNLLMILL
jgi:hypothetical protein